MAFSPLFLNRINFVFPKPLEDVRKTFNFSALCRRVLTLLWWRMLTKILSLSCFSVATSSLRIFTTSLPVGTEIFASRVVFWIIWGWKGRNFILTSTTKALFATSIVLQAISTGGFHPTYTFGILDLIRRWNVSAFSCCVWCLVKRSKKSEWNRGKVLGPFFSFATGAHWTFSRHDSFWLEISSEGTLNDDLEEADKRF